MVLAVVGVGGVEPGDTLRCPEHQEAPNIVTDKALSRRNRRIMPPGHHCYRIVAPHMGWVARPGHPLVTDTSRARLSGGDYPVTA
jgi:hypothetical protein